MHGWMTRLPQQRRSGRAPKAAGQLMMVAMLFCHLATPLVHTVSMAQGGGSVLHLLCGTPSAALLQDVHRLLPAELTGAASPDDSDRMPCPMCCGLVGGESALPAIAAGESAAQPLASWASCGWPRSRPAFLASLGARGPPSVFFS